MVKVVNKARFTLYKFLHLPLIIIVPSLKRLWGKLILS